MPKRKIKNLIITAFSAIAALSACLFTACGKDSSVNRNHQHTMQFVRSQAATCTEEGVRAHWHCVDCGGNFAEATAETRLDSVVAPKLNHVYYGGYGYDENQHYHACYNCGEASPGTSMAHILRRVADEKTHHSECYCGYSTEPEEHAFNDDGVCTVCGYGGIMYELAGNGKYYICTGVTNAYKTDIQEVDVLDQYKGLPVKEVGSRAFFDCVNLEKVHLGRNVITLNDYAFYNCKNLSDVTLNTGLAVIGASAFDNCESILALKLPSTVVQIDSHAFSRTGLREITLPSNVSVIAANAFYECESLEKIVLPAKLSEIRLAAFAESGLTELVLPDTLTAIPMTMCLDCKNLKTVTIPAGVTKINAAAFSGCVALETLIFKGTEAQWNAIEFIDFPQAWDFKTGTQTEAGTYKVVFGG